MKKLLAIILALSVSAAAFTACSNDSNPKTDTEAGNPVVSGEGTGGGGTAGTVPPNQDIDFDNLKVPLQVGEYIDPNSIVGQLFPGAVETTAATSAVTQKPVYTEVNVDVTDADGNTVTDSDGSGVTSVVQSEVTAETTEGLGDVTTLPENTVATLPAATGDSHVAAPDDMKTLKSFWLDLTRDGDYHFNGEFITLKFRVKDEAKEGWVAPISITRTDFSDYGDYPAGIAPATLTPSTVAGSVKVGSAPETSSPTTDGFTIYIDNVAAQPGEEVTVNINVANNPGFIAFIFWFQYDATVLDYISSDYGSDFAAVR